MALDLTLTVKLRLVSFVRWVHVSLVAALSHHHIFGHDLFSNILRLVHIEVEVNLIVDHG